MSRAKQLQELNQSSSGKKRKILYCSNSSKSQTGFGRHAKTFLTELFQSGEFDIVEYAAAPYDDTSIEVKGLPWKGYGATPDKNPILEKLVQNPGFLRQLMYGGWRIDHVVQKEKPDVVIVVEDFWALNGASAFGIDMPSWYDRPWWNKIPCIVWTPIDSLPIYPGIIDNITNGKIKHLWTKAAFAAKELFKLNLHEICDIQTFPALIDDSPFRILDKKLVEQVRSGFGIDPKTKIFGFVFRNQLRKLAPAMMEGFKKFKEQGIPAKLYFHTNFKDGQWDIPRLIQNIGLENDDILTTYICQKCRKILISSYKGPKINCDSCKTKESVIQPNFDFGVTEEELNIIYNLFDFYFQPSTSGGFEMPLLEALLAGKISATVPYSFGLDYIDNGLCDAIDSHVDVWEAGSNFLKAQPKAQGIADLMLQYSQMSEAEVQEKAAVIREKTLELFAAKPTINKIKTLLLEYPPHSYNFDFAPFGKIPDIKKELKKFIYPSDNKKLIYVLPGSHGDCLMSLSVLDALKKEYSDWDFYIATEPQYKEIFRHLNYVKNIIPYNKEMDNYLHLEGDGLFDIAFLPHILTQRYISYHHNGLDKCPINP